MPDDINHTEHVNVSNESLTTILETLAEIRERVVKVETNMDYTRKAIEGNGKPGLLQRVDGLESDRDLREGRNRATKRIVGLVITAFLGLGGYLGTTAVGYVNDAHTTRQQTLVETQKLTDQVVSIQQQVGNVGGAVVNGTHETRIQRAAENQKLVNQIASVQRQITVVQSRLDAVNSRLPEPKKKK